MKDDELTGEALRKSLREPLYNRPPPIHPSERGWYYFTCKCCKYPLFMSRGVRDVCDVCVKHDLTKPCDAPCLVCKEPSHAHPVTKDLGKTMLYCHHGGASYVDKRVRILAGEELKNRKPRKRKA